MEVEASESLERVRSRTRVAMECEETGESLAGLDWGSFLRLSHTLYSTVVDSRCFLASCKGVGA